MNPYNPDLYRLAVQVVGIASRFSGNMEALAKLVHVCADVATLQAYSFGEFLDSDTALKVRKGLLRLYKKDAKNTRGLICELIVLNKLTDQWNGDHLDQWVLFQTISNLTDPCGLKSVDVFNISKQKAVECKVSVVHWLSELRPTENDIPCLNSLQTNHTSGHLWIAFATLDPICFRNIVTRDFLDAGFSPDELFFRESFPV